MDRKCSSKVYKTNRKLEKKCKLHIKKYETTDELAHNVNIHCTRTNIQVDTNVNYIQKLKNKYTREH